LATLGSELVGLVLERRLILRERLVEIILLGNLRLLLWSGGLEWSEDDENGPYVYEKGKIVESDEAYYGDSWEECEF